MKKDKSTINCDDSEMSVKSIVPPTTREVLSLLPAFPIVLVTTRSNIITLGQLQHFTFTPFRIGIAVAHARYTYELLKQEQEFVINVPDRTLLEAVKKCGAVSGRKGNKFEASGLHTESSEEVQAVSIRECGAQIECRVVKEIEFEKRTWFVGEVLAARKRSGYSGGQALLCGRTDYILQGEVISPR